MTIYDSVHHQYRHQDLRTHHIYNTATRWLKHLYGCKTLRRVCSGSVWLEKVYPHNILWEFHLFTGMENIKKLERLVAKLMFSLYCFFTNKI